MAAIRGAQQIWEEEYNKGQIENEAQQPADVPTSQEEDQSLFDQLMQLIQIEVADSTEDDSFDTFISGPPIRIDCAPLQWWCRTEQPQQYPQLSTMAIDILSIPPQSAEPERSFSGSRRTMSWDRLRLTPDSLQMVECTGNWLR